MIDVEEPLNAFHDCHAGIVTMLRGLRELPRLLEAADKARLVAAEAMALFDGPVLEHHQDEERELFPAVLRSAQPGNELAEVTAMVQRLEQEHRVVERLWRTVEDGVRDAARGRPVTLDPARVEELIAIYLVHANFEEQYFLPLAEKILGRNGNHMAALGLSLHMRHTQLPAGYI
ncbi:MAG: hemerythrin domain-containing protein [Burkholderiales bacterium]|nr:hemerythrin domain-containing protein [Burkholderiales bacterium]